MGWETKMDRRDSNMFQVCLSDIVDELVPRAKFKALLVTKKILTPDEVDKTFDGSDREENVYDLTKILRKQPTDVITRFIEALEESKQGELADKLKKNRRVDIESLRTGVKDALKRGSTFKLEEGRVAVKEAYVKQCASFSRRETDDVPGPFHYDTYVKEIITCISEDCAQALVSVLGGAADVIVARRHSGLLLQRRADGDVVKLDMAVVNKGGEDVVQGRWMVPGGIIGDQVQDRVPNAKKVTDAAGKDVDVTKKFEEWWPSAPVGASGRKELHVFKPEAPRLHDIKPLSS